MQAANSTIPVFLSFLKQRHLNFDDTFSAGGRSVTQHQGRTMGIPGEEYREIAFFGNQEALVHRRFQKGNVIFRLGFTDGFLAGVGGDADLLSALGSVEQVGVFLVNLRVGTIKAMGRHIHDVQEQAVSVNFIAPGRQRHYIRVPQIVQGFADGSRINSVVAAGV